MLYMISVREFPWRKSKRKRTSWYYRVCCRSAVSRADAFHDYVTLCEQTLPNESAFVDGIVMISIYFLDLD